MTVPQLSLVLTAVVLLMPPVLLTLLTPLPVLLTVELLVMVQMENPASFLLLLKLVL
jgi:hypothetical protein